MRNGQADYWWLRSPVLEVSIGVWCVDNFGANDNDDVWDVDYSYGRSPYHTEVDIVYNVFPDGHVDYDHISAYWGDSCGLSGH